MKDDLPEFTIFWNGDVNVAWGFNTPELLKLDAQAVLENRFLRRSFIQGRTEYEMAELLRGWLLRLVWSRALRFDHLLGGWRYLL